MGLVEGFGGLERRVGGEGEVRLWEVRWMCEDIEGSRGVEYAESKSWWSGKGGLTSWSISGVHLTGILTA